MLGICPDTLRLMSLFLINKPFRPALLLVLIFLSGALGTWWLAASAARDVDAETLRVTQLALNQELVRERRQLASSLQDTPTGTRWPTRSTVHNPIWRG